MEALDFPGLGLSFKLSRVAFYIFGLPVYWYGVLFGLSFAAGAVYAVRRAKLFGLDSDRVIDALIGAIIGGIIGARAYYVIFSWDSYKNNLANVFNVREGGIAIYGGIIGGSLAILLMCRLRKVKLLPLLDLTASSMLISQAIGRWGNFVNIEAFGVTTKSVLGMTSPGIQRYLEDNQARLAAAKIIVTPGDPVHPTFFYESMWCLAGFILITLYSKRRRFDGELILLYLGWYGLGRAVVEGLRTDSLMLGSVRVSRLLAVLCVIASAVSLIIVRVKLRRAKDPEYLKLYRDADEGRAVLAGTFYAKKGEIEPEPCGEGDNSGESSAPKNPAEQGASEEKDETCI